jgi:uncharacterized protein (DUF849 family)
MTVENVTLTKHFLHSHVRVVLHGEEETDVEISTDLLAVSKRVCTDVTLASA